MGAYNPYEPADTSENDRCRDCRESDSFYDPGTKLFFDIGTDSIVYRFGPPNLSIEPLGIRCGRSLYVPSSVIISLSVKFFQCGVRGITPGVMCEGEPELDEMGKAFGFAGMSASTRGMIGRCGVG